MTYATGTWGTEAQERSLKRKEYFRVYRQSHRPLRISHGSSLGYVGELEASRILQATRQTRGVDLLLGTTKVEVKTSLPTKMGKSSFRWRASLERQRRIADKFLIILRNKDNTTRGMYLIPDDYFGEKKYFSVCESSLYKLDNFKIERR